MAYVNITLYIPGLTTTQADSILEMTNEDTVAQTINLLQGVEARIHPGTIQVTTLTNNPAVTTDGSTGTLQKTVNKL